MIKERTPRTGLSLMVVDKDQTYSKSATALSVGGLRHHFTLKENVEMARFGTDFLRRVPRLLECDGSPPPDIQYHPYGFLQLADEAKAEELQESFLIQKELGCHVELLTKDRIKDKFPWMNTDGVELGFDAWALLFGLKRKAFFHGAEYVQAEVVGFDFEESYNVVAGMDHEERHQKAMRAIVKNSLGELKTVDFSQCIIAAGHESANIAEMARMGRREGLLSVPLPIEARKRYAYCIHAPKGPGIDCPLVADTSGVYFRREGYAGHFVTGQAGPLSESPEDVANLEVDYNYFNDTIIPALAHRVPGFNNVKLNSAWTGLYDYNTFDQTGIIGPHPHQPHMYFACGFSGHGIQMAPAVARGTMELILDGDFRTLDLSRIHFERFLVGKEIKEGIVQ
ncbi:FAD-dependent oxidoreductase domain-containing protein 1 [Orchesella cincta]|uniref:FAD-dependent oxidoreductase domain-containing protein 1 n=1 Tax=Orchesella cincta TaxID=48709 RepID=A0A1D2NA99_ORCCI|nr:FAD-dependent oxidoreductase domain-containing protein 1 [Orchesella cincta]